MTISRSDISAAFDDLLSGARTREVVADWARSTSRKSRFLRRLPHGHKEAPSPNGRRAGIRIVTFEVCSGFTRVTARRIAQPPKVTYVTRLQPCQLPSRAARQLPDLSTIIQVEPSSTDDSRLRGRTANIRHWTAASRNIAFVRRPFAPGITWSRTSDAGLAHGHRVRPPRGATRPGARAGHQWRGDASHKKYSTSLCGGTRGKPLFWDLSVDHCKRPQILWKRPGIIESR